MRTQYDTNGNPVEVRLFRIHVRWPMEQIDEKVAEIAVPVKLVSPGNGMVQLNKDAFKGLDVSEAKLDAMNDELNELVIRRLIVIE